MATRTNGERLVAIEEQVSFLRRDVEAIQKSVDCISGRINGIGKAENNITSLCKDVDALQKSINGMGMRFDEIRKTTMNRVWAIITPLLAAIIMALLVHVYGGN